MYVFTSPDHRPVTATGPTEAARVFASRTARKMYGRRGYVRAMRCDCWTQDGRIHHFQVFIGRDVAPNECSGGNVMVYVTNTSAAA